MTLKTPGKSISDVEILNIYLHGFWIFILGKEYFLPYEEFPWFKNAKIDEIFDVELLNKHHLYWPKLDIDLEIESIKNPHAFPLKWKV